MSSNERAVADEDQRVLTIVFSQFVHAAWLCKVIGDRSGGYAAVGLLPGILTAILFTE